MEKPEILHFLGVENYYYTPTYLKTAESFIPAIDKRQIKIQYNLAPHNGVIVGLKTSNYIIESDPHRLKNLVLKKRMTCWRSDKKDIHFPKCIKSFLLFNTASAD